MRRVVAARSRLTVASLLASAAVGLGGCGGSGHKPTGPSAPGYVDVYSSLPLVGPGAAQARAILTGIRLALAQAHHRAGQLAIHYASLDDASGAAGGWSPTATAANASRAVADPHAVYYIGELSSDASEVSIPILNLGGIAQLSPTNTYAGLTAAVPGVMTPGELRSLYPAKTRTYLRIVPSDAVDAAADLIAMKAQGCGKVAVASSGGAYGNEVAALIALEKSYYGVNVVTSPTLPASGQYVRYALAIKGLHVDCVEYAGLASSAAVRFATVVHTLLPEAGIFGPTGVCTSPWTDAADGGVPASVDPRIECTRVIQAVTAYPGHQAFLTAYRMAHGSATPSPYAIFGYEAMKVGLETIASLGANGGDRRDVVKALFATTARDSALGSYGFQADGDTTLKAVGLYRVARGGPLAFAKTIVVGKVVG